MVAGGIGSASDQATGSRKRPPRAPAGAIESHASASACASPGFYRPCRAGKNVDVVFPALGRKAARAPRYHLSHLWRYGWPRLIITTFAIQPTILCRAESCDLATGFSLKALRLTAFMLSA